jgi:hypothetical protein
MSNKIISGERIARGMKLLMVAGVLCVTTSLSAIDLSDKVDVAGNNITVGELLRQIEEQTDYTFAFNQSAFDTSRRINISASQIEIESVMNAILANSGFAYTIDDHHIIIFTIPKEQKPRRVEQPKRTLAKVDALPVAPSPTTPVDVEPIPAVAPISTPVPVHTVPVKKNIEESVQGEIYVQTTDKPMHGRSAVSFSRQAIELSSELDTPSNSVSRRYLIKKPLASNLLPNIPVSPLVALKTNLLFDATATMNLGVEVRVSPKSTIDFSGSYNPWSWKENRKWKSIVVQPEYRWWVGDPFSGHFIGMHAQWAHYNFGNLPFADLETNRYQGDLYGAGISYGYSWYIGKRWALEATVGLGYNYMEYEKFDCVPCGNTQGWRTQDYFGITKLGLNLSFLIK